MARVIQAEVYTLSGVMTVLLFVFEQLISEKIPIIVAVRKKMVTFLTFVILKGEILNVGD
jgi:hypothetical protein